MNVRGQFPDLSGPTALPGLAQRLTSAGKKKKAPKMAPKGKGGSKPMGRQKYDGGGSAC